jgi:hypothetical protein
VNVDKVESCPSSTLVRDQFKRRLGFTWEVASRLRQQGVWQLNMWSKMKDNLFLRGDSNGFPLHFQVCWWTWQSKPELFWIQSSCKKEKIVQMCLLCALTLVRIMTLAHVWILMGWDHGDLSLPLFLLPILPNWVLFKEPYAIHLQNASTVYTLSVNHVSSLLMIDSVERRLPISNQIPTPQLWTSKH